MTYGAYLHLDELLSAQHPVSGEPPAHDELLFIIQHQTTELWMRLVLHELDRVVGRLDADDHRSALKGLARVKAVVRQMAAQWSVLGTLTPSEYATFRRSLGTSSGFQSWQYRAIEYALGAKDPGYLSLFEGEDGARRELERRLGAPSAYDAFVRWLARRGLPVPAEVLERDVRRPWEPSTGLVDAVELAYRDPDGHWAAYETCEALVDLEDDVQHWRFRHLSAVQRIIGADRGTGGTAGVAYLRAVLDRSFFPELYAVRTRIAGL